MAADRFTIPQDLLVTDSIAVYDTSNHNFCRKMSKNYYCCCRCLLVEILFSFFRCISSIRTLE